MYVGSVIMSGQTAYTPWFPRGGDSARFTFEFISSGGGNPDTNNVTVTDTVTFKVYTKKAEDAGDGTFITGATKSMTSAGTETLVVTGSSGMDDMVRFEISSPTNTVSVDYGGGPTDADVLRFVYYRVFAPVFYDKA